MPLNKEPQTRTQHGATLTDKWAWLRADNWQEVLQNPASLPEDIRTHLEGENKISDDYFKPLEDLTSELEAEIRSRITEDDAGVPYQWGDYAYSWRFPKGADYRVWYRKSGETETTLLDENELAKPHKFFQLGNYKIAPNHNLLAYTVDTQGSEFFTLYVKNLETGATTKLLENISSEVEWSADSSTLLAVTLTPDHKPEAVISIHTTTKHTQTLFVETDKSLFVNVGKTEDGQYMTITCSDHSFNEIRLIPAQDLTAAPTCVMPREHNIRYSITHWDNAFYLLTNDDAPDGQILTCPAQQLLTGIPQWDELVPHSAGQLIEDIHVQAGHLIFSVMHQAQTTLRIINLSNQRSRTLSFDAAAYDIQFIPQYDAHSGRFRFQFSTPVQPPQIWERDIQTSQDEELLKETKIPSGHNADDYIVERIFVTAPDGTKIPVTRWCHKDSNIKAAPVLQYAYGSYGISMPVNFRHTVISLLNRGFVYAIAHIRGGKECGEDWYQNGKLQNKNNTFDDFTSVANHLHKEAGRNRFIAAQGGSAGGMLMGVLANENPASISAIIAQVPFVDVLNTISDDTLPLTPPEWNEWGNPIDNKSNFDYMSAYCPYQNVRAQSYPAIFALAGLTDPRVTYWEPAKWLAKIREYRTNNEALILSTDMTSGHGGASGRYGYISEIAKIQAFVLNEYQQFQSKED